MGKFDDSDGFTIIAPVADPIPRGTVRKTYIVDGKTHSADYEEIVPPKGLNEEQLKKWIEDNIEGETVADVVVNGVDMNWPVRHMEVHKVGEGYATKILRSPTQNSFEVRLHPSMVGKLTDNEAERLAAFAPLDSTRKRMRAVDRRGSLVKFQSVDGKEQRWVYK